MPKRVLNSASIDLFWHWIAERHSIYLKRSLGDPKPWTDDPILQRYKFTNVFRELDAGTRWMRENLTEPNRDRPWPEIIGNCGHYRMFNLIATGEFIGWQQTWDADYWADALQERKDAGHPIFTHAHVVRSDFYEPKARSISRVVGTIYNISEELAEIARETQSLEQVFNRLLLLHLVGKFMAYEIVTDLRHTPVLEHAVDTMTWASLGPGATRGMQRLGFNHRRGAESMRELLRIAPDHLPDWVTAHGLEMRDIEHSLCEFDKYCRVYYNEGGSVRPYPGRA